MKAIIKSNEWCKFINNNDDIYESLWDYIPQPMVVISVDQIVWSDKLIYQLSFRDRIYLAWRDEIEELIIEDGDDQLFSYLQ
jgi:hypothetical protein